MNKKQAKKRSKYATEKRAGSAWSSFVTEEKMKNELQRLAKQPITDAERRAFKAIAM